MNTAAVDLGGLGLDRGGHILLAHALRGVRPGEPLVVRGRDPALAVHLRVWCRAQGHTVAWPQGGSEHVATVIRGVADGARMHGSDSAGHPDAAQPGSVVDHPSATWGLAARGATVEAGGPAFAFRYSDKSEVWTDDAARLYAQAAAAQWDPATAIAWDTDFTLADPVEDAVVQVMTYLIENETAALMVPARFLAQVHPHFREVLQVLAIQAADEARHIEVFTRRALLKRRTLGRSTVGGQASLKTLLDEPDFALATFLLSVLGEGTFLSLLWFLHAHAPDPVTRQVARLTAQDEARHVAFGLAHLRRHAAHDPGLLGRLATAVEIRHQSLAHTAGLNQDVFDALILLAAGSFAPDDLARGHDAVITLQQHMDTDRQARMQRLGFAPADAAALSALHTRNFM